MGPFSFICLDEVVRAALPRKCGDRQCNADHFRRVRLRGRIPGQPTLALRDAAANGWCPALLFGRDFSWCNNHRLPVFGDDEGAIAPVASSPSHRSARRVVKDKVAIALHDRLYCATAMRVCRPDCSPRAVYSVNDEISVALHDGNIAPVFRVHTFSGHQALTWHRESMSLKVRSTVQLVRSVGAQLPKRCPLRCARFRR
mgnify:CR=1 FL=1